MAQVKVLKKYLLKAAQVDLKLTQVGKDWLELQSSRLSQLERQLGPAQAILEFTLATTESEQVGLKLLNVNLY